MDEVGNGRANRPEDVIAVKTAFRDHGRLEEPASGFTGFIDQPLDDAIRGFQRDHELRVDGFTAHPSGRHRAFFGFATRGDIPGMIAELRGFNDPHPSRRNLEADYLEANLPRPKLKPKV